MKPNIGISEEHLAEISQVLSHILADEFVLYTKTRNAHWNIEGPNFHAMHIMFESQYTELADIIDNVAERMRTLGHYAPATLKQILQLTHLTEQTREKNDSTGFIRELLSDHESITINIRTQINRLAERLKDVGTSDYLTGLTEYHEKTAWMLRSHLI
ncbi:Dps family protein [Parapedobacter indicus]|uniref:Starvation-inducible DNA-binding protein n=1 Tax=Parapedobacter indicus TaxID=1477437 RepID=A0A1I3VDX4_9SPHI|nr:DNA starvation/stationary phase protection protein [Parapedobacter indicus]PPK98929.1 starvation-inducible DNA-binding protein [Parapedobacter indicus]SFJ92606.1 starvation-inducible DNA-binding protein [Parapedobacter indicus]